MKQVKILYVEDDRINALIIKKLLGKHFTTVDVVIDGEQCLDKVQKEQYDLVLMDINLGEGKMDGIETMKAVKTLANYQAVPIFAVTSYAMPEDRAKFLGLGFDNYYPKPVEVEMLIGEICKVLRV